MEKRLGREDWVDAAYRLFENGGVSAVRVDPLAKSLNITRGSFYWHFANRSELLQAIIALWETGQTEQAISANEAAGGSARERLLRLLETCASDDGRFEMGIRSWARSDPQTHDLVARIDERRVAYMADLAVEAGLDSRQAEARSRVAYLAWLGSYTGVVASDSDTRLEDMKCLWHMILA